jgi:nitrate reductase cytochrome c-type subunit
MKSIALMALCLLLPASVSALADERVPTDKEVREAENMPPLIPHKIASATDCLSCHEKGRNGAPVTPHPQRKACTQCHIPGEIMALEPATRQK